MILRGTRKDNYGISPESFGELYAKNGGFDREASKNVRTIASSLDEVMLKGGKILIEESPELVEALLSGVMVDD